MSELSKDTCPLSNGTEYRMSPEQWRRFVFYMDGLRYSHKMAEVAFRRMTAALDEIARRHIANQAPEELVISALLDAWIIVDMCHRTRELIQQVPLLSKKLPEIQIFLRATSEIENVRNYVQHFRTQIPDIAESCSPLWGILSWVPTWEEKSCFIIFPGNLLNGIRGFSISYDRQNSGFTTKIALHVEPHFVDLTAIANSMKKIRAYLLTWIEMQPGITRSDGNTLIFKFSVLPRNKSLSA